MSLPKPGFAQDADPLPSWNEGPTKAAIVDFVTRVTTECGADYVKPAERIAGASGWSAYRTNSCRLMTKCISVPNVVDCSVCTCEMF